MFRALLCLSSVAHDYIADYQMGRPVLGLLMVGSYVQADWISVRAAGYSSLPAPNFQPSATQEPDGPSDDQQCSRELLMMGVEMPETC